MNLTSKHTILLAEDGMHTQMDATEALKGRKDVELIIAETREEALSVIQERGGSLWAVILDNNLKDADKCVVELALAALQAEIKRVIINSHDFNHKDAPEGVEVWCKHYVRDHMRKLLELL